MIDDYDNINELIQSADSILLQRQFWHPRQQLEWWWQWQQSMHYNFMSEKMNTIHSEQQKFTDAMVKGLQHTTCN